MKKIWIQPLTVILASILAVYGIARLLSYLIIAKGILPHSLLLNVDGFRLHHFVYGNILIVVAGFIAIGLRAKVNPNVLACIYGIGLGLVLDEFPLWMGDVTQLNSNTVYIPIAPAVILVVSVLLVLLIIIDRKRIN